MKVFDKPLYDAGYLVYRLLTPIVDPIRVVQGLWGYVWYVKGYLKHKRLQPNADISFRNLFPIVHEKSLYHPFDAHYFYQELWAFRHILKRKPALHVDVASKYYFASFVSTTTKAEYVDIRPYDVQVPNLTVRKGSVLELPYKDNSLDSISTLHVIEHVGLGRYGDPIDPDGTKKAAKELLRVLKPGGTLYLSLPLGSYRICFNAHRVHPGSMICSYFFPLELKEFSVVDDRGKFVPNTKYQMYEDIHYGCGMYLFVKKKTR